MSSYNPNNDASRAELEQALRSHKARWVDIAIDAPSAESIFAVTEFFAARNVGSVKYLSRGNCRLEIDVPVTVVQDLLTNPGFRAHIKSIELVPAKQDA